MEGVIDTVVYGFALIGLAAVIAAATPKAKKASAMEKVRSVLDAVAMNFGYAKNED